MVDGVLVSKIVLKNRKKNKYSIVDFFSSRIYWNTIENHIIPETCDFFTSDSYYWQ